MHLNDIYTLIAVAVFLPPLTALFASWGRPEADPNESTKGWPGDDTLCKGRRFPAFDPQEAPTLDVDTVFLGDLPIADEDSSDEQPRPPT